VEALLLHIGGHPVGLSVVGQQPVTDLLNLWVCVYGWGVMRDDRQDTVRESTRYIRRPKIEVLLNLRGQSEENTVTTQSV
jgi:hypothetical protein